MVMLEYLSQKKNSKIKPKAQVHLQSKLMNIYTTSSVKRMLVAWRLRKKTILQPVHL